jgi:hypothetical protein
MSNQSARKTLAARYDNMKAAGLVDVKYLLSNTREATTEQVCVEVNAMYDALERNECKPFELGTVTIQKN